MNIRISKYSLQTLLYMGFHIVAELQLQKKMQSAVFKLRNPCIKDKMQRIMVCPDKYVGHWDINLSEPTSGVERTDNFLCVSSKGEPLLAPRKQGNFCYSSWETLKDAGARRAPPVSLPSRLGRCH